MGRPTNRLTALSVAGFKEPGRHADGQGLYLIVDAPDDKGRSAKRWVFIFQWRMKRKEMGLGPTSVVSLAEARGAALDARRLVQAGKNPIDERRAARAGGTTFGDVADDLLAAKARDWKNAKHKSQWETSLNRYAAPLRAKAPDAITTEDILGVIKPLWDTIPETASRTRGRIELVLDAAKAKGLRTGENPARWRGHLALLLPKRRRLTKGHHPAMPYPDLPAFMGELRDRSGVSPRALEFTILTAARTGETRFATFREFDLDAAVWTIPATRMKMGREHRIPLAPRAVEIVREMWLDGMSRTALVFPGMKVGKAMSDGTMTAVLRRMGRDTYSVHGFRSTFKDWAEDTTNFSNGVIEAALAHLFGDGTERAYRRGDALVKRRRLMEAWAGYCARPNVRQGVVTPFTKVTV